MVIMHDEEPALKCYFCGMLTIPGETMYANLVALVKEHDD